MVAIALLVRSTLVFFTTDFGVPMVAVLTEAKWPVAGYPATSVGAAGVCLTGVLALVVITTLAGGAVRIIAAASYAQVIATQEPVRTVTVLGTPGTAVAVAASLSTVALGGVAAGLDTEVTLT